MSRKIPFLDLRIENQKLLSDILSKIESILISGKIVLGPEVLELENIIADYCGRKYAVGVGSGTDALFLGMKALGIGRGDEVITTPLSWIATANAIALTGAIPVFADIGEDLNIAPASIKRLITSKTKAILPVHFTGKICKMNELMAMADEYNLIIVEDGSQAFGAAYEGHKSGSFGEIACFSMNPMKIFGACGDAGMIVTDIENVYNRLLALRHNGMVNRTECIDISLNGRIDTIQAAILLEKIKYIDEIISLRRERAVWYNERLTGIVDTPQEAQGEFDIYYTYTIRTDRRDELKAFLESQGIETQIQHPILMPEQPAYSKIAKGSFDNAKKIVKQILSLPVHEKLNREDINYVADCIERFYGRSV